MAYGTYTGQGVQKNPYNYGTTTPPPAKVAAPKAPTWDYSQVGKTLTPAQAQQGWDFSGVNQAISGMQKAPNLTQTYSSGYTPGSYTSTYNPQNYTSSYNPQAYQATNFNYQSLPEEYGKTQYALGAKDIQHQGQGNLQQIQEAMGTRRPGLLMKAAQGNARDVSSQLGNLNAQIRMQAMQDKERLAVQQQQDQAGENFRAAGFGDQQAQQMAANQYQAAAFNDAGQQAKNAAGYQASAFNEGNRQFGAGEAYKGYQSRADLEKANADQRLNYLQALNTASENKLTSQQNITNSARAYQDNGLDYLMSLYQGLIGSQNQAAQIGNQSSGQGLGFLGDAAKVGASMLL